MVKILKEEADVKEIADGKIFEATVTEVNKGGLIAKFGNYQVFVPSSQIRIGFVKELDKYVGKTLRLKAEKVEQRRRQIVASQRVILEAEKAERDAIHAEKMEAFFNSIQVGDIVLGVPVRFADFGAFVSVNGFDCLAHISDLSWTGCTNCADVLELNKEYEFKILKIDREKQKVSIGYKQLQRKPWDLVNDKYNVGDVIHGKVVRIVSFGAFVEVEKGIDGLVHVSQIANKWVDNPLAALKVGDEVDAKILDINTEKEK
ncbi:MAG: S1 RNA-binding domain-containing protein, partial [Clostridia bacterium]|nr:S1 RNA-binding domain-containing protein [Clostridia bacterium]